MSRHNIETVNSAGATALVTIGYDRMLDYLHCLVEDSAHEILYSNLTDENAGTSPQDVRYYEGVLESLGIELPEVIYEQVESDQLQRVGNRVVVYNRDGSVATEVGG
jgi:hypothetical protein